MTYHKKYMDRAIELAIENVRSNKGGPFGAVLVKNDLIIAEGVNLVTTTNDPTAHAEICAIRTACAKLSSFQLTECSLYSSCEPCPMCLGALYWARISTLYFAATKENAAAIGFDDSFIYEEITRPIDHRVITTKHSAHDRALEAFRLWSQSSKKTNY
ncbi:TPA: tRNA-specific adenosine deaminase [Candidatus Dependentiae bacterium]|nr:MAG: hypothetical protein UW09_C0004G0136 [candidate division TM6 bacterium GW2011_GWF2_43_87]HBL98257.1 tRNA-specific adenosine deaminase [Candidatus Dependentiae bacterium]